MVAESPECVEFVIDFSGMVGGLEFGGDGGNQLPVVGASLVEVQIVLFHNAKALIRPQETNFFGLSGGLFWGKKRNLRFFRKINFIESPYVIVPLCNKRIPQNRSSVGIWHNGRQL